MVEGSQAITPDTKVGDKVVVPGYGVGEVREFQARIEGGRSHVLAKVRISDHISALVPCPKEPQ